MVNRKDYDSTVTSSRKQSQTSNVQCRQIKGSNYRDFAQIASSSFAYWTFSSRMFTSFLLTFSQFCCLIRLACDMVSTLHMSRLKSFSHNVRIFQDNVERYMFSSCHFRQAFENQLLQLCHNVPLSRMCSGSVQSRYLLPAIKICLTKHGDLSFWEAFAAAVGIKVVDSTCRCILIYF